MLKYLVESTQQIASMMILAGLMLAYVRTAYSGRRTGVMRAGLLAGFLFAVVFTIVKKSTNKVNMGTWNLIIYSVSCGALVLFLVCTLIRFKFQKVGEILASVMLSIYLCMTLFDYLPTFLVMPYNILLSEETVLSTAYLLKFIGFLFGLILSFLAGLAAYKCALGLTSKGMVFVFMLVGLLIETFRQVAAAFSIMLAKRLIANNHTMFVISKYASNMSDWFVYAQLLIGLIMAIILIVRSMHVNEPYHNPAEHRRIRAKWRLRRRWSSTMAVCMALIVVTLTAINAYASKEVELSPIEDAVIENDALYIPFDAVSDGHLHRFGYETDDGTVIRVIVIKKPNSSSYGIGLDACDICGETGYYEKDGQVVCNLCDVVMNINTIGFKGGCNPIVIDYDIENGYIIIPVEGLLEYESEFKS